MKQKKLRRAAAAVAAAAMMLTAVPAVPSVVTLPVATAATGDNIIKNSTFESGSKDWDIYKESKGDCTLTTENGKLALKIKNVGTKNYAVQMYYDIVPLYKNGVYRLSYDISASTPRYVEGMIQQNGGTYQAYVWDGINVTTEPQTIEHEFTMKYDTDIMSKLVFNCGLQEKDPELPEHTIYLDNVKLELIDDSQVDYSATKRYEPDIYTNQVGYTPKSKKIVTFREENLNGAKKFSVINADTGAVAYTGDITSEINYIRNKGNVEKTTGDFSAVTTPGKYYITAGTCDKSYEFTIGEDVYKNLIDDAVRMFYLQRCGVEVEDETFGHKACHTTKATVYGSTQKIDVSGGWHDAGDYGRYVVPGAKAVADLLLAYRTKPDMFGDDLNIAESGNGVPDILDEARFELEWMFKMQSESGGVHHKVSCATFPAYAMPEEEKDELIVTPISSTATADFCASMALAYEVYKDVDSAFADKCLAAAKKAWGWLEQNPNLVFENPKDIVTGEYGDKNDKDERYWAACQMYSATGDKSYYSPKYDNELWIGLGWADMGDYGNIALINMDNAKEVVSNYDDIKSSLCARAYDYRNTASSNPWDCAVTNYIWGSNMEIADIGILLATSYDKFFAEEQEETFKDAAAEQFNYLLGRNAVGTSFVTGYGTVSPEHPHHRPSMAKKQAMKGMLVGGVNAGLEDSAAKAYCQDLSDEKRYIDNWESYSTNEITIYWNSPLIYLAALNASIEEQQPNDNPPIVIDPSKVYGDANCDGEANISDAVCIMQYLANPERYPMTKEGIDLGDVYNRGDGLTARDALSLQMYEAHTLDSLPESVKNPDQPVTTTTTTPHSGPTTTTTTTTATTGTGLKAIGCAAATLRKPDKTEYTEGETVDYTGSWFYFMIYASYENGWEADGGPKSVYLSDRKEDVIVEKYDFPIDGTDTVKTFTGTVDRSKVDTSKAGTYPVTLTVTDETGKVLGKDSFDIVVKKKPITIPDYGTEMDANATMVADFRKGSTPLFYASDGWSNESVFNCFWHKENTSLENNMLSLTIDKQREDSKYPESKNFPYSAAEYRTENFYHYGYYETSMQAIKNDGVVSSFFTYTGEYDILNGVPNPWDEIDIEILGKDTTKVQFNYYTNSKGDHEYMYDLGFDASEGFHTYGFDWQPDHITWYVDGKPVYTAKENIPTTAGRIMMNVWPGITVDSWLKPFNGNVPLTARYQWVTYNKK